ncbi:ABC-2 transporter permease [Clostridium sp. JNZ X4-2]
MWNLVLKDILIQKKTSLFFIAFLIFGILLFQRTNGNFSGYISLVLFCISSNFIENAALKDEISQKIIVSLPLKRSDIISAKYLSMFVSMGITIIIYYLILLVLTAFGFVNDQKSMNSNILFIYMGQTLFYSSLYFPANFKFVYSKIRYLNIILTILVAFGPLFFEGHSHLKNIILKITSYLNDAFNLGWAWICTFLLIILLLISFIISCRVYKNKDLN